MKGNWGTKIRIAAIPALISFFIILCESRRPSELSRLCASISLLLLLADLTSLLRGRLQNFLLVVTSVFFGLLSFEVAAENLAAGPVLKTSYSLSLARPVIGWGPVRAGRFYARKIDSNGKIIYDVHYTIGSDLLRETRSCKTCSTIAFFGDSFTFGEGLNDADTLPQALADDFQQKMRVINLGFSGYGPQQFLREMQTGLFDAVIGPKPKLFIFLTAAWHAERIACKGGWMLRAPRYALQNGQVVYKGPCFTGVSLWLRQRLERSAIYRSLVEPHFEKVTADDVELYIHAVSAAANLAKKKYGVPTLILYLRSPPGYLDRTNFTDDEIIGRLQASGADVLDLSLLNEQAAGAEIEIPGDGHPTGYANRLRASMIYNYLSRHLAVLQSG